MFNTLLARVVDVSHYRTGVDRDHARLVSGALILLMVIFLVYGLLVPDWSIGTGTDVPLLLTLAYRADTWIYVLLGVAAFFAGMIFVRQGRLEAAGWCPTLMLYVIACLPTLNSQGTDFNSGVGSAVLCGLIIVSGLMNGYTGIIAGLIAASATLILDAGAGKASSTIVVLMLFMGIAAVSALYTRFAVLSRGEGEVQANSERLKLADLTSQITRKASQRATLQEVLDLAINLILEKYPQFYHAQIFLIDDTGSQSRLVASTGEVGQLLLARAHALTVGSISIIGQVTLTGEHLIGRAGADNSRHRFNELLPDTKIEAAFPLHTGEIVIGALDLQCRSEYAFTDEDVPTFTSLADSIALVIDNVRQFESARQRVQENQRLAEQARNALREVERLNKRLIGRAWTEFLQSQQNNVGLNIDFTSGEVVADPFWTPTLDEAARVNHTVQKSHVLAVPLRVRGQIIGAMEFELDENAEFSPEDLELVQEISDRFGLAAENTRLVEESQRIAQREALINEISTRMQSTNNVEATLTEAARSLFETLQARRVSIRMGAPAARSRKEAAG